MTIWCPHCFNTYGLASLKKLQFVSDGVDAVEALSVEYSTQREDRFGNTEITSGSSI
jgi:hypothetical protein